MQAGGYTAPEMYQFNAHRKGQRMFLIKWERFLLFKSLSGFASHMPNPADALKLIIMQKNGILILGTSI